MSSEQIHIALRIQVSRADRLVQADDIIENNGSLDELKQKVIEQNKKYSELATK
jgi:dephospho-CoA kinase